MAASRWCASVHPRWCLWEPRDGSAELDMARGPPHTCDHFSGTGWRPPWDPELEALGAGLGQAARRVRASAAVIPLLCSGDTETLGSAVGWGWGGRTTRLAASPGGQAGTQAHPLGLWDIYQRSALSEGGGRGQEGVQRVRRSPGRDPKWTRSSGRRRAGPPRIWGRCRWAESRPPTIQEASASSPSRRPSAEARKTASREVTGEGRLWCQAPQNPEPS